MLVTKNFQSPFSARTARKTARPYPASVPCHGTARAARFSAWNRPVARGNNSAQSEVLYTRQENNRCTIIRKPLIFYCGVSGPAPWASRRHIRPPPHCCLVQCKTINLIIRLLPSSPERSTRPMPMSVQKSTPSEGSTAMARGRWMSSSMSTRFCNV